MIRLRPSGADEILIKRVRDWYEPGPGVFIAPQALFNPAILFTTGVNGTWYDPSDLNTLFQDAAGTTPVTAVEQPVGLMLDKSKGLVLGPELVTNGDFSNGTTGWTLGAGWSVSAGKAQFAPGAIGSIYQAGMTIGKWYKVTYTVDSISGSWVRFNYGVAGTNRTAPGTYSQVLLAAGSFIEIQADSTTTATIDNISVRELPGNHAFNSSGNSANFPVLSARYNLLTKTEDFSDAVWTKTGITATAGKISETAVPGTHVAAQNITVPSGVQVTVRVVVQAAERSYVGLYAGTPSQGTIFNLSNGTRYGDLISAPTAWSISALGAGRYLISITYTTTATATAPSIYICNDLAEFSYTGESGKGVFVSSIDLRVSNDALNQPAYQRVNTATDYDTVGFKPYLKFNGTNQWLQTNSIDFTYGDKMFVCAGVRKLSDAALGMLIELSTTSANNSVFYLAAPISASSTYSFASKGTLVQNATTPSAFAAPITNVVSGIGDIAAPNAAIRVNAAQSAQITSTQGTGNYGNYPLYIGARAGTSLWFNGRLHQLIVAGKQASASEIASTEAFTNQKTGAY